MSRKDTRERIIAAASQVFAEDGLHNAPVQRILEAAGVSRRTFYQHFGTRDALIDVLYDRFTASLLTALALGIPDESEPMDMVVRALERWLEFQLEGGSLTNQLQAAALRPDTSLSSKREQTLDALTGVIDGAVHQVLGIHADPFVYRSLVVGIEGMVIHLAAAGRLEDEAPRVRRVAAALVLNVLAGAEHLPAPPH